MAAQLINGNGFEGCTAQVDADFYEGIFGTETGILTVGQKIHTASTSQLPFFHFFIAIRTLHIITLLCQIGICLFDFT